MKNVASKNNLALHTNLDFFLFTAKNEEFWQEKFEKKLQEKEEKMSLKTENLLKNGKTHAR